MHVGQSATEELACRQLAVRRLASSCGPGYPSFRYGTGARGGYRDPPHSTPPWATGAGGHPPAAVPSRLTGYRPSSEPPAVILPDTVGYQAKCPAPGGTPGSRQAAGRPLADRIPHFATQQFHQCSSVRRAHRLPALRSCHSAPGRWPGRSTDSNGDLTPDNPMEKMRGDLGASVRAARAPASLPAADPPGRAGGSSPRRGGKLKARPTATGRKKER
jgi:hypothetical protein